MYRKRYAGVQVRASPVPVKAKLTALCKDLRFPTTPALSLELAPRQAAEQAHVRQLLRLRELGAETLPTRYPPLHCQLCHNRRTAEGIDRMRNARRILTGGNLT